MVAHFILTILSRVWDFTLHECLAKLRDWLIKPKRQKVPKPHDEQPDHYNTLLKAKIETVRLEAELEEAKRRKAKETTKRLKAEQALARTRAALTEENITESR